MLIYGLFDKSGAPLGFYHEGLFEGKLPEGTVELTPEQWVDFIDHPGERFWIDGKMVERPFILSPEEAIRITRARISARVRRILDQGARARGYDDIVTACGWAGDPHAPYAREGDSFVKWRSAAWRTVETLTEAVLRGERLEPTLDEIKALVGEPSC